MRPEKLSIFLVIISAWVLFSAHFMQHFFDIQPCILCIWQRYVYYGILFGAVLVPLHKELLSLWIQNFLLLIGALISFYHSGIERKFWKGFSSCSSDISLDVSVEQIMEQIQSSPLIKCEDIAFSFLGLTLSNYNLILSVTLLIWSIILYQKWKKENEKQV